MTIKRQQMMNLDCEKPPMEATFAGSTPDTLIEAKLSKIPKAFSIENLIAKKSKVDIAAEESHDGSDANSFSKMPPIANFPFYNPWAANYLMSHANLPQNLLLNGTGNQPQHYQLQLHNDKLAEGNCGEYKDKFTDLLFNPLLMNGAAAALTQHDQATSTYLQLQHDQFSNMNNNNTKFKDTNFLSEFHSNYFISESNRLLLTTTSSANSCDNINSSVKRTRKPLAADNVSNDSSEFDVVNGGDAQVEVTKARMFYEEDSSYSDLSVTLSPENLQKPVNDKGELRNFHNSSIHSFIAHEVAQSNTKHEICLIQYY